jgi:hypothetical protein
MIRRKLLIATAIIASVVITACSDMAAPKRFVPEGSSEATILAPPVVASSHDGAQIRDDNARRRCGPEVTFTKWYTSSPFMTGFTCYGPGTYAGQILSRSDDGVFTQLKARYEVTDPRGRHSFKAVIQGTLDDKTGKAELDGVVIEGWRIGAPVHVTFQKITPCAFAVGPSVPNVCFQGTIHIQRARPRSDDGPRRTGR